MHKVKRREVQEREGKTWGLCSLVVGMRFVIGSGFIHFRVKTANAEILAFGKCFQYEPSAARGPGLDS